MRLVTKADRLAARWKPKGAIAVVENELAAIYVYQMPLGKLGVLVYRGSAGRPEKHIAFKDADAATGYIAGWLSSAQESVNFRAKRQAAKREWQNPLKVGDQLYTSWGYDQTNVEFYAVTRVSGKRVWVREIAGDYVATGDMTGRTRPASPVKFIGPETMHTAQPSGERGAYIKISESQHAWPQRDASEWHGTSSYA
jgi:hypothetical protein